MTTPDFSGARLPPILERLIERTEAEEIEWDVAAVTDGYAVTVGDVRFRVHSMNSDGEPPYVLEFLINKGPSGRRPVMTGHDDRVDSLLRRLYHAARTSAVGEVADPFDSVEHALGLEQSLDDPDST